MTEVVYVIGACGSPRAKIGRSKSVGTRLGTIQRMSPIPLSILWQTDGGSELESALHRRFDAHRVHGEWFDFGDRDPAVEVAAAVDGIRAELTEAATAAEERERRRRERRQPANYGEALRFLDEATVRVLRLRTALAEAETEATEAVAAALKSCLAAGANRTEVQKHSPFSPPTVRKIGEDAGIAPDERYVRSIKDKPES